MPLQTILIVIGILIFATFVRSAIGFGDALIAMPLLTLIIDLQMASPLFAVFALTMSLSMLITSWKNVDLRVAWRLVVSAFPGVVVGLFALKNIPEAYVITVVGVVLILYGLFNLFNPRLPHFHNEWSAFIFGFIAGILGGAYNTNGPPVVIYGTLRKWPPELFRATLQSFFFPTGIMIVGGHAFSGLLTADVIRLYAYALLGGFLALWLGGMVNSRIPKTVFSKIIYGFLVVIGIVMLVNNALPLLTGAQVV